MNIEGKPIKLSDVSKKLNQEIDTIVDFLLSNGIIIESNPDTDISIGIYLILLKAFRIQSDSNRDLPNLEEKNFEENNDDIQPIRIKAERKFGNKTYEKVKIEEFKKRYEDNGNNLEFIKPLKVIGKIDLSKFSNERKKGTNKLFKSIDPLKHSGKPVLLGLVKWYNEERGFGVVTNPDEGDFFLHISNFFRDPKIIKPNETCVIFNKWFDSIKNRNTASNCRLIGEVEDWGLIMYYLGKNDKISLEIPTKHSNSGLRTTQNKNIEISLVNKAVIEFFKSINLNELSKVIIEYFNKSLIKKHFILYCENIVHAANEALESEASSKFLNDIFTYFKDNINDDILFDLWKEQKLRYINKDVNEFEISEHLLKVKINELGLSEINRIKSFSYGSIFIPEFLKTKFNNIDSISCEEIEGLYPFLSLYEADDKDEIKYRLDRSYAKIIGDILTEKAQDLDFINNDEDYDKYDVIKNSFPKQITEEEKAKFEKSFNEITIDKCSEKFKVELWLKGIIEEVSFDYISETFINEKDSNGKKSLILSKLSLSQQLELLKMFSDKFGWEKSFELIENFVKKENSLSSSFSLSRSLTDPEFWNGKKCFDLVDSFHKYFKKNSEDEIKYELFKKGFINYIPQNLIIENIDTLSHIECERIITSQIDQKDLILEILIGKISDGNISDLEWIYDLGNKYLDAKHFTNLDKKIFASIDNTKYFTLWESGKGKILPKEFLEEFLNDKYENFKHIDRWIESKILDRTEITEFLLSYLRKRITIINRSLFYKHFNYTRFLIKSDINNLAQIKNLKNELYEIFLWFLDVEQTFDFEILKQKFIYFSPEQQVRIIKKLFYYKAINQFDFTIERLNELTRFDVDLYQTSQIIDPTIHIDISTDVIIKALSSFKQKQSFISESELLSIVLKDLKYDKTKKFLLSNYFEECDGRMSAEYNWESEGTIRKIPYGHGQFYFAVKFPTGTYKQHRSGRRWNSEFVPNRKFDNLRNETESLPGCKWNIEREHWGIPSKYEKEVIEFAKKNRFSILGGSNRYADNVHLAEFKRIEIPNGILFCEGRLANKPHETYKKIFWWCIGQPCFEKCETIHNPDQWENYTLLDFCQILNLDTDEINHMGDFIPKGYYYQFIGTINRFNQLLERLYCQDCGEILHPVQTSHFGAHNVLRFHCLNESCPNNEEIYLNHCLNGKCTAIIDSRISKTCNNGLFICSICGSCCSHDMFARRLNNLKISGGYIHNQLKNCVEKKLGHLERGKYFCFNCGQNMVETNEDFFECKKCNVKYDTSIYNFKRPHKYINEGDNNQNTEEDYYDIY